MNIPVDDESNWQWNWSRYLLDISFNRLERAGFKCLKYEIEEK